MMVKWNMTNDRLMDLERTVDVLNGRLREVQLKLQQRKTHSLTERLWKGLMSGRQRREFMSAVCNRRIRPNTKVVKLQPAPDNAKSLSRPAPSMACGSA
jgi:hypothetical protein